ncbi:putative Inositol polyphosphate kinase [Blattamonas nauphoetae]|uniref:Kinase n=1 Tax=Blattamonas nauphoetae TaxID=2049346 RepID=A0ABQ9YLE7_9EUKA|nr:putative Inositol polyphosphate kinase [Blattamonas nauphoetae]
MIDIKMGTIQTPNTVDPARYHHQQTKCLNSTSSVVGYRLAGLSYHNYNNPHLSVFRDKYWGRLIPADQLEPILHSFFSQSQSTVPILESFLHDLNEIISFLLTDEGKAITFIGVSVHLLYDLSTNPPKIGLHLIDFNSCTHSPPTFDTGFLKGLESLRTHLSSVMKILTSESPTQGSFFGGSLDLRFRDEGIENRQLIQKKKIERRIAQQKGNK